MSDVGELKEYHGKALQYDDLGNGVMCNDGRGSRPIYYSLGAKLGEFCEFMLPLSPCPFLPQLY